MDLQLETPRLLLRPFEMNDAEALFEMDKNPIVHKYLWQTPVDDINEVYKLIELVHKQYEERGIGRFSTILKETGELIGWTGIKYVNDHIENGNTNFYDYGYRINEPYWGKGYATEATEAWLKHAFNNMNIETMHAYTHYKNEASNHILKKTGFEFMEEYTAEDGIQWNWWKINQK